MQYYFVMTQINAGANQRQKHQQYKYTKVIFQLVVIYFVCWYPSMIMSYMVPFNFVLGGISQLLIILNALLDPLIYMWIMKDLRSHFLRMFCPWYSQAAGANKSFSREPTVNITTVNLNWVTTLRCHKLWNLSAYRLSCYYECIESLISNWHIDMVVNKYSVMGNNKYILGHYWLI